MARPKKKTTSVSHLLVPEEPKTEWQKVLAHIEENLKLYIAGALFIVICVAIGALIRINTVVKQQNVMTDYAEAALEEDAAARLEKYKAIGARSGKWTPEVLYMTGETAIEAGDLESAKEAFGRISAEYGDSAYAPNAKDGLAFLAWNDKKYEEALGAYEELVSKWPGEFIARRAHYNIGQLLEELDRPADAIAAYRKQATVFPESTIASKAEQALEKMKGEFPDLFVDDTADAAGGAPEDAAQTGILSTGAPSEPATEQ